LACRLPFAIDESDCVNEAFASYMATRDLGQKRIVDLWTYCYVRRYFLIKFLRETRFQASELDQVVEKTYRKVERAHTAIERHDRYAQWVSVVCRNTFVNFVSRRQPLTGLETCDFPAEELDRARDLDVNAGMIHAALLRSIAALPLFLQATARMRFVENLSNEEIGRIVGKRTPTIRAYIHKINKRFRSDPELCAWAEYLLRD
ncbi:MAG: sigma-70 family RNA polymerase sigma factor, partial [Bacteroidetes bacterium]|nr:sigma-70 family RNA polymerase sigma factor [Bacteroidota bacterium]